MMGSQPVKLQGFVTTRSPEHLRKFYKATLAKRGWTFDEPPWREQVNKQRAHLDQIIQEHGEEIENVPDLKARLESTAKADELARRQLHAKRGSERLLLHFDLQEQGTFVLISRWEDRGVGPTLPQEDATQEGPYGASPSPTWPAVNVCCDGQQVPAGIRKLPASVPQYPNARMVTASSSLMDGRGMAIEMYLSADSAKQIADFYQMHMGYNGWSPSESSSGSLARPANVNGLEAREFVGDAKQLAFRNDQGMCGLFIAEKPETPPVSDGAAPSPPVVPADSQQAAESGERTLIMMTYFESPWLSRAFRGKPMHLLRQGPPQSRIRTKKQ
jgi:hypothetical protein